MSAFDRPHMIETDKNQIIEPGSQSDLGFLRSIRKTDHPWHAVWKQFTGERKALGQGNWCELNVAREINGLRREVQFATLSEWDFDFSKMPQVKEQSDQVAGRVARELIKLSRMENLKTINVRQLAKSEIIGTTRRHKEINFTIEEPKKLSDLFLELGLEKYAHQEKDRVSFTLKDWRFDLDQYPKMPAFIEIEGDSEQHVRDAITLLGLENNPTWAKGERILIQETYNLDWYDMRF